jgi:GT2 family glycosyltransferase
MDMTTSHGSQSPLLITVIMACHNRAVTTQRFFQSFMAATRNGIEFEFVVTNDGSTDETKSILDSQAVQMKVYNGTGALYWAKSMAKAESLIQRVPDGILWVNDDLILGPNAFVKLQDAIAVNPKSVLVGQVEDVDSGHCVYGGYKRRGRHPLVLDLIYSEKSYEKVDTFNGNFVYIPIEVRLAVGAIDSNFSHGYADCDYGYRVQKSGFGVNVIPGFIGKTELKTHSWPSGRIQKVQQLFQPKYSPFKSQLRFFYIHRKNFGLFFIPLYLIRPILKILIFNSFEVRNSPNSSKTD